MLIILNRLILNLISSVDHAVHWKRHLSPKEAAWLMDRRSEANLNKLMLTCPALAIWLIAPLLWRASAQGGALPLAEGIWTSIAVLATVVVLSLALHIVKRSLRKPVEQRTQIRMLFSAWFVLACLAALLWQARLISDPTNFVFLHVLLIIVAAIPTLTIIEAGILYGALAAIEGFALYSIGAPFSHYLLYAALTLVSLFFNQLFFYNYLAMQIGRLRLKVSSESDALTGLYNRRGLMEWLNARRKRIDNRASRMACGFIDIDKFKMYNDTFGHIEGDACLKAVSALISDYFEPHAAAVCRFGGEEIVVIFIGAAPEQVRVHFENMARALADLRIPAPENGISEYVTVSIGLCCAWLKDVEEVWDLIDATDEALYAAKENGRNRIEVTQYIPKRRKVQMNAG